MKFLKKGDEEWRAEEKTTQKKKKKKKKNLRESEQVTLWEILERLRVLERLELLRV